MSLQIPRPRSFEVIDVASPSLVADWERHNAEQLIELSCAIPDGRQFHGREVTLRLDEVSLGHVSGTAHSVARDAALIAERPADAIAVYAAVRGEALVEYDGRRTVMRPGQLLVCDIDRPLLRGFGHGLEEFAVRVPRHSFAELTGWQTIAAPLIVETESDPYARALVRLVGRSVAASVPVPAEEQAVLELVSVLATGARVGLPMAHRAAARAFIDDHLTDSLLSAADVAAGAGISERHLSRLFAGAGTSVPRYILGRRLDLAHALLTRRGEALRTVDVAARSGFTSTAYFSQAFRRRFGITAGEVRRGEAE